jgi:hypothetical protein
VKVIEVRIDAVANKFQLRHLRGSPAIGIGVTQFANGDEPAGRGRTALAIDSLRTQSVTFCRKFTDGVQRVKKTTISWHIVRTCKKAGVILRRQ